MFPFPYDVVNDLWTVEEKRQLLLELGLVTPEMAAEQEQAWAEVDRLADALTVPIADLLLRLLQRLYTTDPRAQDAARAIARHAVDEALTVMRKPSTMHRYSPPPG